jgi:hypothetical protein
MPKTNINYSKTIIYKIACNDLSITECYVGSTTEFTKRKHMHKSRCCNSECEGHNFKVYEFIRENGGWSNWSMIPVEQFEQCKNNLDKLQRERYWIEQLNAKLNMVLPGALIEVGKSEYNKEYSQKNRENMTEYQRKYVEKNKDKFYAKHECACGGKYVFVNKSRHDKTKKHEDFVANQAESQTE